MKIENIILIIWIHFFADFILQSQYMGENKSKKFVVLLQHGLFYTIPFLYINIFYAILNGVLHICIDFVTSRITSVLYKKKKYHKFFVTIGADQAIHLTVLILTWYWGSGVINL